MLTSTHNVHCNHNGCSHTLAVSGAEATRAELYQKARKAGWSWPNAGAQFCPDHVPARAAAPKKAKAAKKATPKKAKAKVGGAAKPRKAASLLGVPSIISQ